MMRHSIKKKHCFPTKRIEKVSKNKTKGTISDPAAALRKMVAYFHVGDLQRTSDSPWKKENLDSAILDYGAGGPSVFVLLALVLKETALA